MTRKTRTLVALLLGAGIVISQLAWVSVIQPYAGMDEFDHAYRAASVARGHWTPHKPTSASERADLVWVPADIVRAAHDPCKVLVYTDHDNCNPASSRARDGNVLVISTAAAYNPIYYWIVGSAALHFHGAGALYAMRLASLLLCDLFLIGALAVALRRCKSPWPVAGIVVCTTPMVAYSTAIVAPNGVQAAASVLMWSAFLPVVLGRWKARTGRLLLIGSLAACVVVTVHTTGPLWLALSAPPLCVIAGRRWLREALTRHRVVVLSCSVLMLLATLGATWWAVAHATNSPSLGAGHAGYPNYRWLAIAPILWALQSIASIPFRDDSAPTVVYAIGLLIFVILVVAGWRASQTRQRVALAFIAVCSIGVPLFLSIATWNTLPKAWQGRYGLPLSFALPLIAAWALDMRRPGWGMFRPLAACITLGYAVMQTLVLLHVRVRESHLVAGGSFPLPSPALLIMVGVVSALTMTGGMAMLGAFQTAKMTDTNELVSGDPLSCAREPAKLTQS